MQHLEALNQLRTQVLSNAKLNQADWHQFQNAMYENGIGMEETLKYLYHERPDEEAFHIWLKHRMIDNTSTPTEEVGNVLTEEDLTFWNENGYIVIKNAITKADVEEAKEAILSFMNVSMTNPASWYQHHEAIEGLMVLFTHHPALEKNRASPKIRKAYEQLYNSTELIRTTDKVSFNPPETNGYTFKGSAVHWDVSLKTPIPFKLQGLLYLTDVQEDSGAFHCVPGFHNNIEAWLATVPENVNPRAYAVETLQPIPITGQAGDFVIWHQALPHCATPNRSGLPRIVQYLTYFPKDIQEQTVWI